MRVTVAAPAKVNLWLRVGPREPSGFHGISTLFCALDLADTVVLRRPDSTDAAGVETSFAPPLETLPDLGPPDANLAVRAARAFVERAGVSEVPHVTLVKRIPSGGGLGGGSSDAGAVLRALRRMHPDSLTGEELTRIAADIGSDVPFFVLGSPLAHGAGRGERLMATHPLPPRPLVLVLPPFPVNTADAYRWLDESRGGEAAGSPEVARELNPSGTARLTWAQVAAEARNDFEAPVFERHPGLRDVRDRLRSLGARPALLAGSGSTVFGVFADADAAHAAARALRAEHPEHRVLLTATRTR